MTWNEAYEQERRAALEPVEDEFRSLPRDLLGSGRLLRAHLLAAAGAEDLAGVFAGLHDYPALHLHYWVLEETQGDPAISPRVFTRAGYFTSVARHLAEAMHDPDSLTTGTTVPLIEYFKERAYSIFQRRFPADSAMLKFANTAWDRFDTGEDRLAPHKLPALGAAISAGWRGDLSLLDALFDRINIIYLRVHRLRSLRRDLQAGNKNPFVIELLTANGIVQSDPEWASRLMGALVITEALEAPIRAAETDLLAAREASAEIGLGTFETYLNHLQASLNHARTMFRPGARDDSEPAAIAVGFSRPAIDTARMALKTAEAFLTSDLTFAESWEVHRYGLFGRDLVVSRFPAGLVLEILCETGYPLIRTVDAFIAHLAEHHFSYFDDQEIVIRDADTLGLALRLWRYGSRPEGRSRDRLEVAIELLERSVGADGRIPVWLEQPPPGVRLAGEGCGAVEAHLLLGLLAFDPARFEGVISHAAAGLFKRFSIRGSGISVNYPNLYALTVVGRLAAALEAAGFSGNWMERWEMRQRIDLATAIDRPDFSPQEAAFAIQLCAHPGNERLRWSGYPVLIRKHQRSDGSWNAEPFCFVANRGNQLSWYSSRTLTTAFCYRALQVAERVNFDREESPEAVFRMMD